MSICSKNIYNWSLLLRPEFHAIISKHRERWGQLPSVAIKVQQLLEEQTKLPREADAMRLPDLHNLQCKSGVMRQQHSSYWPWDLSSTCERQEVTSKRQRLLEAAKEPPTARQICPAARAQASQC